MYLKMATMQKLILLLRILEITLSKLQLINWDFYDGQNMKAELNSRDFYSDTIQPGKSATGVAYFDVKNDTPNYEVYFADASWTGSY